MKVNDSMIPLPNSVDIEKAVIGAVLLDNNIFDDVSSVLGTPNMFYKNAHRTIWYSILKLREEGAPIDLLSLVQELISNKQIDNVGGAAYIAEISGEVATATNALYHSKLVLEDHKRRTLIHKLEEMTERAYNKGEDLGDIMSMIEDFDPSVAQSESCLSVSDTIAGTFDEIENAFKNPGSVKGMNTGVTILNKLLGGWQPGEINILAARPSVGKTALALYSAMKCGVPSYFVSAEMSRRMVEHRLIGSYLGAPAHVLKSGHLKAEEYMKMQDAERHLKNIEMYIEDRIIDSGAIAKEARRLKREKNIGIIFIDYLQLLDPPKDENRKSATQNREREISIISSKLKMLAKELDIPVVALSQLSRESERLGRKPILSDLRESGSLEQDADVVIFLHRDNDLPDYVDCIVAKNRQGATGSETLRFRKDIGEFSEVRIGNE